MSEVQEEKLETLTAQQKYSDRIRRLRDLHLKRVNILLFYTLFFM